MFSARSFLLSFGTPTLAFGGRGVWAQSWALLQASGGRAGPGTASGSVDLGQAPFSS